MSRPASPTIATTRSSDAELMSTLASGDIGALAELYDRYHTSVRRFLIRATGNAGGEREEVRLGAGAAAGQQQHGEQREGGAHGHPPDLPFTSASGWRVR